MAVNKHFHTSGVAATTTEKSLYSDLVAEAIQIYGHDVYYMDRTLVNEDTILGEDSLSKFKDAAKVEMYMEDAEGGFAGEKEMLSHFGLQNLSEATFVVNKLRFQEMTKQIMIESGTSSEEGGSILVESGTLDSDYKLEGSDFYILSETAATDSDRPLEGDTIYHPILEKLFQINFVDHDEPFHQLDNNPVYKLRCRLFEYSSEILDTGVSAIDAIETTESVDALVHQFTLEQSAYVNEAIRLEAGGDYATGAGFLLLNATDDSSTDDGDNVMGQDDTTSVGESILLESLADTGDDAYLIQEDYIIGDFVTDKTAQNELFDTQSASVLDFTETNPFGDVGRPS
tara:strand:+ start:1073 stop:2101 length:1029 start_codon:yes stop_codon:yes gene_type:complete